MGWSVEREVGTTRRVRDGGGLRDAAGWVRCAVGVVKSGVPLGMGVHCIIYNPRI